MGLPFAIRHVPQRVVTGAFVLHSGLEKWNGSPEQAEMLHGLGSNAYPQLKSIPPDKFLKLLSAGEITTGSLLLAPFVSSRVAGLALTAFAGSLLGMYWRTESMHKPGSIWPTPGGIPVSKDVWMLGIGLGLMLDQASRKKS